ncbi:DUF3140 domain-containing protein [Actinomadura flavalba]|uniref:DUF3140 domain-containing protein n=1 Tax=Actinomadura flavalba TaxID=1120938 RepID=UPI000378A840|nr:DUF3140 domain-containing protein [Actinomadura flavalba]
MDNVPALDVALVVEEFHRLVTMTADELAAVLGSNPSPATTGDGVPVKALGERVLELLRKRPSDLTPDDTGTMAEILDAIEDLREADTPDVQALQTLGHTG